MDKILTSPGQEKSQGLRIRLAEYDGTRTAIMTVRRYDRRQNEVWLTVATGIGNSDTGALRDLFRVLGKMQQAVVACGKVAAQLDREIQHGKK